MRNLSFRRLAILVFLVFSALYVTRSYSYDALTCEGRKSFHLNENFPAKVVVISTSDYKYEDIRQMIFAILKNNDGDVKVVSIDSGNNFFRLREEIKNLDLPDGKKEKYLRAFIFVLGTARWSQDFFESFYDGFLRKPFLRMVEGYKYGDPQVGRYEGYYKTQEMISQILRNEAGVTVREAINHYSPVKSAKSGHRGGNIESTNEGHCLIGSSDLNADEWSEVAALSCSDPSYAIRIPTEWLPATHVDELLKPLPPIPQKTSCQARFFLASAEKAIEILNKYPEKLFLTSELDVNDAKSRINKTSLSHLCAAIQKKSNPNLNLPSHTVVSDFSFDAIIPPSGYQSFQMPSIADEQMAKMYDPCIRLRNGQVAELLTSDVHFRDSVELAATKERETKQAVRDAYAKTRPDCQVDFVELPALFVSSQGRFYSADRAVSVVQNFASALLPNPVNSLQIHKDLFVPDPLNADFKSYVEDQVKQAGLNPIFLDTFNLHADTGGNIHCSSQTVRACQ